MTKPLAFDTLQYSSRLEAGGIQHANTHAATLADAITENIYIKSEVDKMIEMALKNSDAALKEFHDRTHEMQLEMRNMETRSWEKFASLKEEFNEKINETTDRAVHRLTRNLSIIATIFTGIGAVLHYGILQSLLG